MPAIGLGYNSGSGNSAFGLGWDVGIPSIARKTEKQLPQYKDEQESDTFILSGAEDLVPLLENRNVDWDDIAYTLSTSQKNSELYISRL